MLRFLLILLFAISCSSGKAPVRVEHYQPVYRTSPPNTVYSRVMWSHPPHPIKPRVKSNAPLLLPNFKFELPNSTFDVAIESLAQAMGYRWDYPSSFAKRKIKINMQGDAEEILAEINLQAKSSVILDHSARILRIENNRPTLPKR